MDKPTASIPGAIAVLVAMLMIFPHPLMANDGDDQKVKLTGYVQFWLRHTALNPGSFDANDEISRITDFSLRRYRFKVSVPVSTKSSMAIVVGNNNVNANSTHLVEMLDAYYTHRLSDNIRLGFGKVGTQGPLRYSAPPSSSNLTFDIPIYQLLTLNKWDQKSRKLSLYTQMQFSRLSYMLSVSKPIISSKITTSENFEFSINQNRFIYAGYFNYYLLGEERALSPYPKASYLGEKELMVLGIGFTSAPSAMSKTTDEGVMAEDLTALGVDFFLERQVGKDHFITCYAAYLHSEFGDNYLRQVGVNNPVKGSIAGNWRFSKPGNNVPLIGTGETYYYQLGFLAKSWFEKTAIQFFQSMQYSRFQRYNTHACVYSGGVNILLNGHRSKVSIGIENRPVFNQSYEGVLPEDSRKSSYLVQYQVKF